MNGSHLWFSDYNKVYHGSEPSFYQVQDIPIALYLEKHYPEIKEELKKIWEQSSESTKVFARYDSFDDKQYPVGSWEKMVFKVWGLKNKIACEKFQFTSSLLAKFPHITSCFVTKTTGNSMIKSHCGETNAHIRIHLGLHVPEVDSSVCGMEVLNQTIGWKNGKVFAFLDAHNHHVWNNSDSDRYVLIVDVLRPEFVSQKNFICARVIISQLYFYLITPLKLRFLLNISSRFLDCITAIFYLPVLIITYFNNRLNFIRL